MRRIAVPMVLLALLLGACRTAPIYNVQRAPIGMSGASLEDVGVWIDRAARLQEWRTEAVAPGTLLVTKSRGRHVATATIRYDATSYSITLRNSIDLKQRHGEIHKAYNEWIRSLDRTIRREVAAGPLR